ncbi:G patch domain-containing protein 4 [Manduca sexta]|uniref:G patch domain-containing protein 4 n=1 Tax=Manduca sexta TaxID=7130 RepID=A0A921YS23_MANSE|nr:G patch domain-containing protein 4 [Manduca sexta]KAG6444374.1 hypothetical protein O3G_MSEX003352 [Manduca sexta]
MDFARKQLLKYGWSEGKGLGKHENGISQPLKPKIKRSVTGVGHDPASEFNEHWWSALYDKAAGNVEVHENNGKTKKINTKGDLTITTNTWQISKGSKKEAKEQYSEFFLRTAVLTKGGNKVEKVKESDSEDEAETEKKDVLKMTDEELFAACEGRTAHKGARHGLKATGKLARIAQQEAMLLSQSKYNGYSHAKKIKEPIEDAILSPEETEPKKKKKKRKRCFSNEGRHENPKVENLTPVPAESSNDTNSTPVDENGRKNKLQNDKIGLDSKKVDNNVIRPKKKSKRKIQQEEVIPMETDMVQTEDIENISKKKKLKELE